MKQGDPIRYARLKGISAGGEFTRTRALAIVCAIATGDVWIVSLTAAVVLIASILLRARVIAAVEKGNWRKIVAACNAILGCLSFAMALCAFNGVLEIERTFAILAFAYGVIGGIVSLVGDCADSGLTKAFAGDDATHERMNVVTTCVTWVSRAVVCAAIGCAMWSTTGDENPLKGNYVLLAMALVVDAVSYWFITAYLCLNTECGDNIDRREFVSEQSS